jgi:hypothetical protein
MKKVCDKKLICVDPCSRIALNDEYRAIREGDGEYQVMDLEGDYRYFRASRFVEKLED